MAIVKLFLPKVGEGIMEATIIKWLKQEGDSIKEEESIVEVTTDKLEGNNSQLKVWSALTEIRYGRTSNYKQIAHNIKEPKAIRRVANTSRTLFFMQRFHWIFIYLALKGTLTSSYYKL